MYKNYIYYIYVNFQILIKIIKEYKINMILGFLQEFSWHITMLPLFFYSLNKHFGFIIGWNFLDFFIFFFFMGLLTDISGLITWNQNLIKTITNGKLNEYRTKPVNTFFIFLFSNMSVAAIIAVIGDIIIFIIMNILFDINYYNLLFSFIIALLILINYISLKVFCNSIAFINFGLSSFFKNIREYLYNFNTLYPYKFYEKFDGKFILALHSIFFIGSLLTPIIRNHNIQHFNLHFTILISTTILFIVSIILLWNIGLRKYNAYG